SKVLMTRRRTTYVSYSDIKRKRRKRILCVSIFMAAVVVGVGLFLLIRNIAKIAKETSADDQLLVSGSDIISADNLFSVSMDMVQTDPAAADISSANEWISFSKREDRIKVRGIYVTGPMAGSANMENLIDLIDNTELNAVVIDVKNDEGNITYQMNLQDAQEMGACINYISDMEGLMAELKEHNIYTIARIVCFKDPYLAEHNPQLALKKADGSNLTDAYGLTWVNPYKEEVWEYLTDVALAAADMGFDEIQYDYVRFPIGNEAETADYGVDIQSYPREQAIMNFLDYAAGRLHEKGIPVTADVFGTIIGSAVDVEQVGQDYVGLGSTVDVLCPMIYPSHYGNGVFGYDVPDAYPYETVYAALLASKNELAGIADEDRAVVRPWLQAFTATWVSGHITYGGDEIREQIQAVYDAGYEEWILWNASNRYTDEGLEKAE
ncbi:MAG: putative glycoside hydrolase, partial [Lachnospiraceae bacterium]|nr:putative glycoside hydrolase [Lachnospiraceae bacterium]